MPTLLLKDATLVHPSVTETVDVLVRDGVIQSVASHDSPTYAVPVPHDAAVEEVVEAAGLLLYPGLIDAHVHFREPGLTEKATMASEARAALAGGVTTVCEMPNTRPPTVTVAAFKDKVRRARRIHRLDIRFFFGATEPEHLDEFKRLLADPGLAALRARCAGLKLFLDHSTGNQRASMDVLTQAFVLAAEHGVTVACHCEDPEVNARNAAAESSRDVTAHSRIRSPESEEIAVSSAIDLARRTGAALHVVHVSTAGGVQRIREAKEEGLSVTCEAAPHHLFLTVDDYATLGPLGKMNPPLRTLLHRDALWKGIEDGTIDCVATDHAPHLLEEKTSVEPLAAPSGAPGVETMLPLLSTVASGGWPHPSSPRPTVDFLPEEIRRLCFDAPNRIYRLGKTDATEGAPANIVLVDPGKRATIRGAKLHGKCHWTPYEGWKVRGVVSRVL